MATSGDFGNPLRKFKLVFLGEQAIALVPSPGDSDHSYRGVYFIPGGGAGPRGYKWPDRSTTSYVMLNFGSDREHYIVREISAY